MRFFKWFQLDGGFGFWLWQTAARNHLGLIILIVLTWQDGFIVYKGQTWLKANKWVSLYFHLFSDFICELSLRLQLLYQTWKTLKTAGQWSHGFLFYLMMPFVCDCIHTRGPVCDLITVCKCKCSNVHFVEVCSTQCYVCNSFKWKQCTPVATLSCDEIFFHWFDRK